MMIDFLFKTFVTLGAEWVLWILIGLSMACLAVIFERFRNLRSQERLGALLWKEYVEPLMQKPNSQMIKDGNKISGTYPCIEGKIVEIFQSSEMQREQTQLVIGSFIGKEKLKLEKNLSFLGTIGSNAPFIGLFGTVLGIIKTFHQLSLADGAQGHAVSSGLAEALVATAVGLLVAIPAVISFNYFQRKIQSIIARSESLSQFLTSLK